MRLFTHMALHEDAVIVLAVRLVDGGKIFVLGNQKRRSHVRSIPQAVEALSVNRGIPVYEVRDVPMDGAHHAYVYPVDTYSRGIDSLYELISVSPNTVHLNRGAGCQ